MSYQKPYYNRFTQFGKDARGYQTGYPQATPTDTTTGRAKGWKFVQFVGGVAPQPPELNEMQSILQDQIKDIGDQVRRNGQTTGLQLRVDRTVLPVVAHIEWEDPSVPGKVYIDGLFHTVEEQTLALSGVREEIIAIQLVKEITTAVEDPALYDPIEGSYNSQKEGAYRWSFTATPVVKDETNRDLLTDTYEVWVLQDGLLKSSSNDVTTPVDQRLINYTYDLQGDCLVRGMRVKVVDADDLNLLVTVDRGRAYVAGRAVGYDTTTTRPITKSKVQSKSILSETIPLTSKLTGLVATLNTDYSPSRGPIFQVTKLSLDTVIRKQGLYNGGDPFSLDPLDPLIVVISNNPPFGPVTGVVSVFDTVLNQFLPFTYVPSKGFRLAGPPSGPIKVVWSYTATLVAETSTVTGDFGVVTTGSITTNQRSIQLHNTYPSALDQTLNTLNSLNGDKASYLFPGVASTRLTANAALGDTILSLVTVSGLVQGQQLNLGVLETDGTFTDNETVVVSSFNTTTNQVQLAAPLTAAHQFASTSVYTDPVFVGLDVTDAEDAGIIDYEYMLDRVDVVYIDADNNIVVQPGQSNVPAYPTTLPQGVLPIAQIRLPANGNAADVTILPYPVQRQSQQDLQKLLARVDQADYNASILNLQLATYNKSSAAGLALRSILTDAFVNSNTAEIGLNPIPLKSISIDPDNGILTPELLMDNVALTVDTVNSTCFVGSRTATMGFLLTGSSVIVNQVDTDQELVRSNTNPPKPTLVITTGHYLGPADRAATWNFFNPFKGAMEPVPKSLEGGFWRTRQGRTPWLENQALFMPALSLTAAGRNFTAGTYHVKIDGALVKVGLNPLVITVGSTESFNGILIPITALNVSGHNSRTVSIVDSVSGLTLASTIFGVTPSEAQFLPIAHDTLATTSYAPVSQTFIYAADKFVGGVNVAFAAKGTGWLDVEIRNTDLEGRPGTQVLARKRLLPADATLAGLTAIVFDDPVFCPADTAMALTFVAQRTSDATQWALKKAVVGHADTSSGAIVATKPIAGGAVYTSVDGGGFTVQQESVLTFTLMECSFRADKKVLQFMPLSSTLISQIPLMLTRAQQLVPRGSVANWSMIINAETLSPLSIAIDSEGTLDPVALPRTASTVTLKAEFTVDASAQNISAQLGITNPRVLLFSAKTLGIYVSRLVAVNRPATNTIAFNSARVTLQLLTSLLPSNTVKVKFTTVDDPVGQIWTKLTGASLFGDQVTVSSVVSAPFSFTYQPTGVPTLAELAQQFQVAYNAANLGITVVAATDGADQRLTFTQTSGQAFILGDLTVAVAVAGASLASNPMTANYQLMARRDDLKQVIDTRFTEHTFDLTGLTPTAVNGADVFRVQVELVTVNALQHPQVRNLACVVST